jgi:hypothetical protein
MCFEAFDIEIEEIIMRQASVVADQITMRSEPPWMQNARFCHFRHLCLAFDKVRNAHPTTPSRPGSVLQRKIVGVPVVLLVFDGGVVRVGTGRALCCKLKHSASWM